METFILFYVGSAIIYIVRNKHTRKKLRFLKYFISE